MSSFEKLDLKSWQNSYELILRSTIFISSKIAPVMSKNKFGRIITVTSSVAREPSPLMVLSSTLGLV